MDIEKIPPTQETPSDHLSTKKPAAVIQQWAGKIGKQTIQFRAQQTVGGTWTFEAWRSPRRHRTPDFVFQTLLKDRQPAQRLVEMSLEDELSAELGLPRPYFDTRLGPG